ncbi:MAG: SNF2 helicase-associated domain-containing protein, partial [Chloroflexota bacterium]
EALSVLLSLSTAQADSSARYTPSSDFTYWSTTAGLVLETLAMQKFIPVIAGDSARWLPVLDSPRDAQRLAQLEGAMPAVCRSGVTVDAVTLSPRELLTSFIHIISDSLARTWGKTFAPRFSWSNNVPAERWLEALFKDNPTIELSPNQIQNFVFSQRAWMRNLHVAGDAAFRIAFRLEAPVLQDEDWQLHYLLQAKDDPSLLIPAGEVWKKTKGVLTHLGHRFEQPQEKLLAGLGYAARLFPPIADSLKSKRPAELAIDTGGAYTFLRETAPLLEGAGFGILVPPWWNKKGARLGVKLSMKPKQTASTQSHMSLESLIGYRWKLSLGETELSEAEFKALAMLKSPLVQIRGQWVTLDAEQIEAAIKFWEKKQLEGDINLLDAMRMGIGGETTVGGLPIETVVAEGWLAEWLEKFSQSEKMEVLPQPEGLIAELRPYQKYGFSWLAFLRQWGLGACLADDMGLGKTIQTISLLVREKEAAGKLSAPVLLIAPTSVVTNWEREIEKFAPGLQTYAHRGADRLKGEA